MIPVIIAKLVSAGVPARLAKPLLIVAAVIGAAILLWIVIGAIAGGKDDQAEQTTRSSEAIADSAEDALNTVMTRNTREASIDALVIETAKEIDNAPTPAAARAAAVSAVCSLPEYRADPACPVR